MAPSTDVTMVPVEQALASRMQPPRWQSAICRPVTDEQNFILLLENACKEGDVERLQYLLNLGIQVDTPRVTQMETPPPLMLAVMYDHPACAELMIAHGAANVNVAVGPDLETALHVACARGGCQITRSLVDAQADLCAADLHGRSPLLISCVAGQAECASILVDSGAYIEQPMAGGNPGATPLYAAACSGSMDCVSLLCDAGANVHARTSNGASAMLVASQEGHLEIAMLLSSYGAGRGAAYLDGHGIITIPSEAEHLARDSGNKQLLEWLQASYRYSALHHVRVLTPQRAIALLRSGCSPHARPVPLVVTKSPPTLEKSPAEVAREHEHDPHAPAAKIILRAAEPWSIHTHSLWGANQRARAVELCKLGYLLAARYGDFRQGAFIDVWLARVLPLDISWECCHGCSPSAAPRGRPKAPARPSAPASPPIRPTKAPHSPPPFTL